MSGLVHLHTAAERDLSQLAEHIRQDNPRGALRFLRAARATFERLSEMPELGSPYETDNPELVGLRWSLISGFRRHLFFYRPIDGGIEVLRVLHGSRDLERIFGTGDA